MISLARRQQSADFRIDRRASVRTVSSSSAGASPAGVTVAPVRERDLDERELGLLLDDDLEVAGEQLSRRERRRCAVLEALTTVLRHDPTGHAVQPPSPATVLAPEHIQPMSHPLSPLPWSGRRHTNPSNQGSGPVYRPDVTRGHFGMGRSAYSRRSRRALDFART
jgi:hypothetical protein